MSDARRPLLVVAVAALLPVIALLALAPFHHSATFPGSGHAEGACPAPIVSAVRRSGDGLGLWTARARDQQVHYFPRASARPVEPTPSPTPLLQVPQAPCHGAARVRIIGAAVLLVVVSLLPGLGDRRDRRPSAARRAPAATAAAA